MEYLSLYIKFIGIQFRSAVEYRGAFLITFIAKTTLFATDLIMIWLLIYLFQGMAGWEKYEVMFLYSLNLASWAFAGFFLYAPFNLLSKKIVSGEFDDVLTKPLNPLLYLISREASTGYISNITVASVAFIICIIKLNLSFDLASVLVLLSTLFGATLIQASLLIFTNVPAFWIVQNKSIQDLFQNDINSFIRYPISAYNKIIQFVLTVILPYAFISFYPSQYFLGKNDFLMFPAFFQYLTPLVGVILIMLAYRFWLLGIKHYNSTGS